MTLRLAPGLSRALRAWRYHRLHRDQALFLLRRIEQDRGPTNKAACRTASDYAVEVLGSAQYAPWLWVYCAIAGEFRPGWIPDNYFGHVVLPALKGARMKSDDLPLAGRVFDDPAFVHSAHYVNRRFWTPDMDPVHDADLAGLIFARTDRVVFKLHGSMRGQGIHHFARADFDPVAVRRLGPGVFQPFIEQHPLLAELSPGAASTVRLTTVVLHDGTIEVRAGLLRNGRKGERHVIASSSIVVPFEVRAGALSDTGYDGNWHRMDAHPDTGARFAGRAVPAFDACVDVVLRLHARIRHVATIGWDLTVDRDNCPRVLELNAGHNDIKRSEATSGPCFADLGWENLWRDPRGLIAPGPGASGVGTG